MDAETAAPMHGEAQGASERPGEEQRVISGQRVRQRRHQLKILYGITIEQYDDLLKRQDGLCGICGHAPGQGKILAVDHDHSTGKVRGLLCNRCNHGLGRLENRRFVSNAHAYLRVHGSNF